MGRKAIVAMSGGVDSSVAAALMKDDGYDVTGIMMKLWKGAAANNESGCCSLDAAEDARRVAQVLDIPFYVFNFAEQFSQRVIDPFVNAYAHGVTPNPCVECNRSVKFSLLQERALVFDSDVVATGHYARISFNGSHRLLRGVDRQKDQSYVLYMLDQEELAHARFPVGGYSKAEIREIASTLGLRTANKPESQEICFTPNSDTHSFLREHVTVGSRPGPIVTSEGKRVGTHQGFAHYTIGQRRGLGVGAGIPLYVKKIDPERNAVVVAEAGEIMTSRMKLSAVNFVKGDSDPSFRASVMARYRGKEADALVELVDGEWTVEFDEPQQAVAPGQAAVFYRGDEVLGGGTISETS